jgi:hypothetical protein
MFGYAMIRAESNGDFMQRGIMRRPRALEFGAVVLVAAASFVLATGAGVAAGAGMTAPTSGPSGSWGTAEAVPGTTSSLNSQVNSVSCASPGNCAAGGSYRTISGPQAFVVNEKNGTWGTALEVPGTDALNTFGDATVAAISCSSPGNCGAGGFYSIDGGSSAFVVDEKNGTWQTAIQVPGITALDSNGLGHLTSVSCASPGNCSAGGFYLVGISVQPFVVTETKGTWGNAAAVPGTGSTDNSQVDSVSCASPGNCVAGGGAFQTTPGDGQAFVVTETGGTWSTAQVVPGTAALNTFGDAATASVSCTSAGNCSAGGYYSDSSGFHEAFVVTETAGIWGTALQVPLGTETGSQITSVSCTSAGNCGAGGGYVQLADVGDQAFVLSETHGTWHTPHLVGPVNENVPADAEISAVSCPAAGDCAAVGFTFTGSNKDHLFVVGETGGIWGAAQNIPGLVTLGGNGFGEINTLSCTAPNACAAGGFYPFAIADTQAFVVTETPVVPTTTAVALSNAKVAFGDEEAEHVKVTVSAKAGTPTGSVTVTAGAAAICKITLKAGTGSCALPAVRFAPGPVKVAASYGGAPGFGRSATAAKTVTITKAGTKTTLTLSAATVRFGHEQAERLTVTVAPRYAGTPGGRVMIKAGTATVCDIALKSGRGTCALTAKKLPVGTYHLVATYAGNADFTTSVSVRKTLTVTR